MQQSNELQGGQPSCPRCQQGLRRGAAGRVEAQVCDLCGGVWLEHGVAAKFNQALADKCNLDISESARIVGEMVARKSGVVSYDTAPTGLPCVVCGKPMYREHVERAGFELDICEGHGTFFDRGELQTVAHLVGARPPEPPKGPDLSGGLPSGGGDGVTAGAVALGVLSVVLDILSD